MLPIDRVADGVTWAQERLETHFKRETERAERGLETDMERYAAGRKIVDE